MKLSAEDQLLIQCARVHYNERNLTDISQLLQRTLDWDYIISASIQHSTALLLYNALKLTTDNFKNNADIPDSAKTELETLYLNNQNRTARLRNVLAEIFKAFRENDIEVIALKERGLIPFAYPDANLHPIGDLDLLIQKHAYKKAESCLIKLGYLPLPDKDSHFQMNYLAGFQFHRSTDNTWLDIQWEVENKTKDISGNSLLKFEVSRIWQNAKPLDLAGHQVLVASPVDMLFHLCIHLEGHGYTELILLTDIAEAIRAYKDKLNWDDLVNITTKYGMQATLYYVLLWVKTLFEVPVPPHVFKALTPLYFKANFFEAIFGNLETLHSYSDEIDLVAKLPTKVIQKFEKIVRRQAEGAKQLYQVIDATIQAFKTAGGQFVNLNGEKSPVILPSLTLPAFNPLKLLIFTDDLHLLNSTLQASGFKEQAGVFEKIIALQSTDRVLENCRFNLTIKCKIETDKHLLFQSQSNLTKKEIAIHVIKDSLIGSTDTNLDIEVTVNVHPLQPEEILALLCVAAGQMENGILCGICNILEFFRTLHDRKPFDWNFFLEIISSHYPQLIAQIYSSLVVTYVAADTHGRVILEQGMAIIHARFQKEIMASKEFRLFSLARHSSESFSDYDVSLKHSLFLLYSFLSVYGWQAKLSYLWHLISSDILQGKGIFRLGRIIVGIPFLALRIMGIQEKQHYSPRDFVYWID